MESTPVVRELLAASVGGNVALGATLIELCCPGPHLGIAAGIALGFTVWAILRHVLR